MDSVESIFSPLFFPNPSSQPLLTLYVFHSFLQAPLLPFGFQAIIVSVLFFVSRFISVPAVLERTEGKASEEMHY